MFDILKKAVSSISSISHDDWMLVEPYLYLKNYKKGEFFYSSGEVGNHIGFLIKGSFKWYFLDQNGEQVNYWFFLENSFLVEYGSFLSLMPSEMYVEAMEKSEIIMLPEREKILEIYSRSHAWERFGRIVSENVYMQTASRLQDFLFRSAEERYLDMLKKFPDIFQRVSLSNISSFLGIKGPSLSRIRKRIRP